MKLSVIVPCYNEEQNIKGLVERFKIVKNKINCDFELILVDNGSTDRTRKEILSFGEKYYFIKALKIDLNEGYGNGIIAGLNLASGDYIGWIHADLQSDPEIFIEMYNSAKLEREDFFYKGSRTNRSFVDNFFTFCMSIFETLYLKTFLWDINAQPTLMNREFYINLQNPPKDFSFDLYIYYMAKKNNVVIKRFKSVQHKRQYGYSSWNDGFVSRIKLIKRVLSFSRILKNE